MTLKLTTAALLAVNLAGTAGPALAQGYHLNQGYTTQSGTYVQPHYQTNPNATRMDNWSTQGNTNPYTGQPGTQNPYGYPR
jgi:hypothetical protein